MKRPVNISLFLWIYICLLAGCRDKIVIHTAIKNDGKFSIPRNKQRLAQQAEDTGTPVFQKHSFDTVFLFADAIQIPLEIWEGAQLGEEKVTDSIKFLVAKKGFDLYFSGDQNFNDDLMDDSMVVRKDFFKDTSKRWLRSFDKKIVYPFYLNKGARQNKVVQLDILADISKVALPGQVNRFAVDILYQNTPSYRVKRLNIGGKGYVAIVDNLSITKTMGYGEDKVYLLRKRQLKKETIIDITAGYYKGDILQLGRRDYMLDYLSFQGDAIHLTKVKRKDTVIGVRQGNYTAGFSGENILLPDTVITSGQLFAKPLTLLLFWSFWCPPCKNKIPDYKALYQSMDTAKTNMVGIILDYRDKVHSIKNDIKDYNIKWQNILSDIGSKAEDQLANIFKIETIATYVIVDHRGQILYRGDDFDQTKEILLKGR
jgi:thiol-disulfide isomerase/thioredoxin